jgi:predicted mannosyl-3-phosphoglycerate phosphatase (HAD superfamily)
VADDETVTDEFQGLLVDEALRRLAPNYAIITGKDDKEITKIVVLPKGEVAPAMSVEANEAVISGSQVKRVTGGGEPKRTEPFKFEFDPSAVMPTE